MKGLQPKSIDDRGSQSERAKSAIVMAAVAAIWLWGWVPSFLTTVERGRRLTSGIGESNVATTLSATASTVLTLTSLALLAILALLSAGELPRLKIGQLFALLLPWIMLHGVSGNIADALQQTQTILYPVFAIAIFMARVPLSLIYRLLATLTVANASIALLLGVLTPWGMMPTDWHSGNEKALIGSSILAGAYSHSNQLGLGLALGIPLVALCFRGSRRGFALGIVLVALAWSSSRTSLYVSAAVVVLLIAVGLLSRRAAQRWLNVGLFLGVAAMVVVPLATTDLEAFTNRGLIWVRSLQSVSGDLIFGLGPRAFTTVNELTASIGSVANTGHNIFVTVLTTGGLALLAAVTLLLAMLWRRASFAVDANPLPLAFLVTIVLLGVVEDPLRAFLLSPNAYIIWPMIVTGMMLGCKRDMRTDFSSPARAEASSTFSADVRR